MSENDEARIPCSSCQSMILPVTATRNNGLCGQCRRRIDEERVDQERIARRRNAPRDPIPERLAQYPARAYENWSTDPHQRWIDAGHTFGTHLMKYARDQALARIPDDADENVKAIAAEAIQAALFGVMEMLDGYYRIEVGKGHVMEYVLQARLRNLENDSSETFELGPDGDGLCMGFAGWWKNEFWW